MWTLIKSHWLAGQRMSQKSTLTPKKKDECVWAAVPGLGVGRSHHEPLAVEFVRTGVGIFHPMFCFFTQIPWQGHGSRWPGWKECGRTAAWVAWCHFANCSGIWKRPARCPGRAASRAPWRTAERGGGGGGSSSGGVTNKGQERYESRARLWTEEHPLFLTDARASCDLSFPTSNKICLGDINESHLLQGVADNEEAFAGQNLLLHGHRVLQQLHDEGQQSAAARKKEKKGAKKREKDLG